MLDFYPPTRVGITQTGLFIVVAIPLSKSDTHGSVLPPALRAVKGSTPNVRLSHNTPNPCEPRDGFIHLRVKHYDTFITHRQQLCVILSFH